MWRVLRFAFTLLLLSSPVLSAGCNSCGKSDKVAELIAIQNAVYRDFASKTEKWRKASKGEKFAIGDGLKTDKNAGARLRLVPDGQLIVKEDTIVRFQATRTGDSGQRLYIETGDIEIESKGFDLQVDTVVGLSRIEKGSRVRISSTEESSNFDVLVGAITVEKEGKVVSLASGKRLELDIGGIIIDRKQKPEPQAKSKPEEESEKGVEAPQVAEPEALTLEETDETDKPYERAPTVADITILAGESATVHDPAPPTNVRIPLENCENGGIIEFGPPRSGAKTTSIRGDRSAIMRLQKGLHRYRVLCFHARKPARRVVARGELYILPDAAIRRLPKTVPNITIEADGRPYTVRYQNYLPQITFRWPDPAISDSYSFHIKSGRSKERTQPSPRPEWTCKSGEIDEGSHLFYFSTSDGRKSAKGKLRIAFDNTARTAYLSEPREGEPTPGQTVRVIGTALTQSKVSIDGRPVSIDLQGRFQTETVAPSDERAIAVRVQQKNSKIHYYLRHVASNE
ncbi:MAG: hypothetical protein JXA30_20850 [Deltaproteobacteria bacterium]|nr:hypothetical protein [Deltaproteobacteria bacterium]